MATGFRQRNRGPLRLCLPPSSPRTPTATPEEDPAMAAEKLKQQIALRREQTKNEQAKARKQRRKIRAICERADAAAAAVVAVESAGRATAAAAAVGTGAGGTSAAGGGSAPALISKVAVVEAVALAVEIEVEAQPSSSASFSKLKDNTDRLFLACKGLDSTAKAVAATVAAEKASVAAGAAVAAWTVFEGLRKEIDEQDHVEESASQRATEEVESRAGKVSTTKKGTKQSGIHLHGAIRVFEEPYSTATAPPEHGDDDSHDSGSTFKGLSSEGTGKEGGNQSEGTRGEGQQMYLVDVGGTYYPTGGSPSPLQQEADNQSWGPEGNIAADCSVPMDCEHQQASEHGENGASMCNPSPSDQYMHPQGLE